MYHYHKKTEKVLSFDQAANLSGWSYWENKQPLAWGVISPIPRNLKDGERLNSLYEQYDALVERFKPNIILCEPPIGGDDSPEDDMKGHRTLFVLSQVMGLIEMIAAKRHIRLEEVPAARWQFNCGIHKRERQARKQGAMDYVVNKYGIAASAISQDVADSLCIASSFFIQRERDASKAPRAVKKEEEECAF